MVINGYTIRQLYYYHEYRYTQQHWMYDYVVVKDCRACHRQNQTVIHSFREDASDRAALKPTHLFPHDLLLSIQFAQVNV